MKKLFSLFLFLFIFVLGINIVNADESWFIKKDEQGNLITNAEFEIYSLFGNNTFEVTNESTETESLYSFLNSDEITKEKGLSLLNDDQKELINSINTYNDFHNKESILVKTYGTESEYVNDLANTKGVSGHIETITRGGETEGDGTENELPNVDYISLTAQNFLVLEETKAPIGMERNKFIMPLEVTFYMTMNDQGALTVESTIYTIKPGLIKYNSSVNFKDLHAAFDYIVNNSDSIRNEIKTGCDETYNYVNTFIPGLLAAVFNTYAGEGNNTACSHNPVIIDKAGTYDVSVTSYVNDNSTIDALKQDVVRLKVKLTNNGTVDSYNNVIVSHIPEGLSYVEDSVSDSGVFDEIEQTVTWNIDRLDASSSKEFTYDVKVPNNVKVNSSIIANASLNSDNVPTAIVSNNSTIKVKDFVNPKTGDLEKLGFVIALTIATAVLYILHGKKKFLSL